MRIRALIARAEEWLREQGMHRALGPISMSIWEEPGLLIEGYGLTEGACCSTLNPFYGPRKIGSIVVADADLRPLGIFTLKDLLNRVALPGVPLDAPISRVDTEVRR